MTCIKVIKHTIKKIINEIYRRNLINKMAYIHENKIKVLLENFSQQTY